MMSVLFPPRRSGPGNPAGVGVAIAFGMVGCFGGFTAFAGETQDERTARLGYAYDEQVHAAAVAQAAAKEKVDKGGNDAPPTGVVRLPKYIVSGERVQLQEYEVLTAKGRMETAKKRYLNTGYQKTLGQVAAVATFLHDLNHGWRPNGPEAMALYEDGEQKRRNGDLKELVDLVSLSKSLKAVETPVPRGTKPTKK